MGGVLELGTTELVSSLSFICMDINQVIYTVKGFESCLNHFKVLEDPALLQQITASFWELPISVCSEQSISSPSLAEKDDDILCPNLDQKIVDTMDLEDCHLMADRLASLESGPAAISFGIHSFARDKENDLIQDKVEELHTNTCEELKIGSPDDSSNECCANQQTNDSFRIEELNGTSQVQNGQLMDDEISNGLHDSLNSNDCISQSFVNPRRFLSCPAGERIKNHILDSLQKGDYTNLISLDLEGEESHYLKTLAAILMNSKQMTSIPCFPSGSHESSFGVWRRKLNTPKPHSTISQRLLKKILVDTTWMHAGQPLKPQEENGLHNKVWKSEGDDASASHVLSERRRREKLNEKFLVLRSLVPFVSKVIGFAVLAVEAIAIFMAE